MRSLGEEPRRAGDVETKQRMEIYAPGQAKGLKITQRMWEDFLCDPVMAAWVIMKIHLDAFQALRLRLYWWVPWVIDSSGFSSGKTIVDWIFTCLRCILIPDHKAAVFYPSHGTGKNTFWEYFDYCEGGIFRAQIGETNQMGTEVGDGMTESGSVWTVEFRNGNRLVMPAPSFMRKAVTQASTRYNTMVIEEWTHVEATGAVDSQLIGRNTRESYNQHHPIWGNHFLMTAPAATSLHPAYRRIKKIERTIKGGDPTRSHLHFSYKDYSNLPSKGGKTFRERFRVESTIAELKNMPPAKYLGEGLGIWGVNGVGWFNEELMLRAQAMGLKLGLRPVMNRNEFDLEPEKTGPELLTTDKHG